MSNILIVSHNLNLEGAPIFLLSIVEAYIEIGHSVTILSEKDGPLKAKFENLGAGVKLAPIFDSNYNLEAEVKKKYDIVILNTIILQGLIEPCSSAGIKPYFIIHESEIDHYKKVLGLTTSSFQNVKKVVFVSHATAKLYNDLIGGVCEVQVIHNGIDVKEIDIYRKKNTRQLLREKYNHTESDKIFVTVGTLCQRKGQVDLIDAAIELFINAKLDDHTYFYFIGFRDIYDGGVRAKEIVGNYSISKFIRIIDMSDDVFDYLGFADFYLCNSYIESFPLTILEAMSFGLPIGSSDVYGIKEQLENNVTARLFTAGRKSEIQSVIKDFHEGKDEVFELGRRAREKVELEFPIKKMKESYIKLISK